MFIESCVEIHAEPYFDKTVQFNLVTELFKSCIDSNVNFT